MLSGMTPTPWHEQITYYRRRADEYDATSYRDLAKASARIAALAGQLCPTGDLLEIACGTGNWTGPLAEHARTVTAIDAAPEMIALARRRVTGRKVTFVAADVLRRCAALILRHCPRGDCTKKPMAAHGGIVAV